jgi:1-acyl-sn-glycerol-3-phosphate acyltransferase
VRAFLYHVSRLLVRLLAAPFFTVRVMGPRPEKLKGAWILAANHISHFDPPLIGGFIRRKIDWMAMTELFANPVSGTWLRSIGGFPVDRSRLDRNAVRIALERLRAGDAIGIFPEGGIRDGERSVLGGAPIRPGVAGLAQMTGAPIVPCVIIGTDRGYTISREWRSGRRIPVWIGFGEPLPAPSGDDRQAGRAELEEKLAAAFRTVAQQMRTHFNLRDEDFPKSPQQRIAECAHRAQRDTASAS